MSQLNTDEQTVNAYLAAFDEQMRANRRSNDFLKGCTEMWERREATQIVWLVDSAVRTYMPEMLGEPFTEAEIWPSLRTKVLEDLKRVDFQAWSVRNNCPIEHLDDDAFEQADHVIITQTLNPKHELPQYEQYTLPSWRPWEFVGIVPESGYNPPKPSWWDHPKQYWTPTRRRHNGRPIYEPVVCVRPSYDVSILEVRVDLQRLGLPLEARKIKAEGRTLFEISWDRDAEPLPANLKSPQTLKRERIRAQSENLMGGNTQ